MAVVLSRVLAAETDRLGDLPTWVGALAAVGAFIFAVWGTTIAKRLFDVERGRDEDNRALQRQAEAAKVAAWYSSNTDTSGVVHWGVRVKNQSQLPIYDLRVAVHLLRNGAPLSPPTVVYPPGCPAVVPPEHEEFVPVIHRHAGDPAHDGSFQWLAAIEFTDSQGIGWRRDVHGKLHAL